MDRLSKSSKKGVFGAHLLSICWRRNTTGEWVCPKFYSQIICQLKGKFLERGGTKEEEDSKREGIVKVSLYCLEKILSLVNCSLFFLLPFCFCLFSEKGPESEDVFRQPVSGAEVEKAKKEIISDGALSPSSLASVGVCCAVLKVIGKEGKNQKFWEEIDDQGFVAFC